ncbi:Probable conserved lipoprotein LpqG [Mycobacteroides abscessus]|nr:Probable conserved lipoprotein LpqG [Mycobacteroides abscessus]
MGDITVVGHGEASGSPDVFMATVGVSVRSRRIAGVMADVKAKARAVIDAVIDAGVAADDVRTAWMSVHPQFDGNRITGYAADNSVRITVRDLSKVSDVLDKAVTAGGEAAQLSGVSFDLQDSPRSPHWHASGHFPMPRPGPSSMPLSRAEHWARCCASMRPAVLPRRIRGPSSPCCAPRVDHPSRPVSTPSARRSLLRGSWTSRYRPVGAGCR